MRADKWTGQNGTRFRENRPLAGVTDPEALSHGLPRNHGLRGPLHPQRLICTDGLPSPSVIRDRSVIGGNDCRQRGNGVQNSPHKTAYHWSKAAMDGWRKTSTPQPAGELHRAHRETLKRAHVERQEHVFPV